VPVKNPKDHFSKPFLVLKNHNLGASPLLFRSKTHVTMRYDQKLAERSLYRASLLRYLKVSPLSPFIFPECRIGKLLNRCFFGFSGIWYIEISCFKRYANLTPCTVHIQSFRDPLLLSFKSSFYIMPYFS